MRISADIVRKLPEGEHTIMPEGDAKLRIGDGVPVLLQDAYIDFTNEEGDRERLKLTVKHPKVAISIRRENE